ncbi:MULTISPECIES: hypothetical protein [unclassified Helicobacter]|uniref:hypothetical protein n=1 Tax=unclassified Helicobacter TaxID=2593540 RepID=UPI0011C02DDE|nr:MULTISPECIES: hypothetical protein [unclassified Helicobacter]
MASNACQSDMINSTESKDSQTALQNLTTKSTKKRRLCARKRSVNKLSRRRSGIYSRETIPLNGIKIQNTIHI